MASNFEEKRQTVVEILQKLHGIWDLAEGFLLIVQSEYVTEKILDVLIDTVQQAINKVKSEEQQSALQSALSSLERLKEQEAIFRQQDEQEADLLLSKIL